MFVCIAASSTTRLILDPRGSRQPQNASGVGELMDALRVQDPDLSEGKVQATAEDGRWLFQVVFVV